LRWNQVVIEDESEWGGKKMMFREVFSAITENSFLQTVYKGESAGDLKKLLTISATRKTPVAQQAGSGRCEPRLAHFTRNVSFAPGLISSICSKKEKPKERRTQWHSQLNR
jgi:hypothetical protein